MDPALIAAITGLVVGVGGLGLNFVGQRTQGRQQYAADAALDNKGRLDETQQAIDSLMTALTRSEAAERTLRAENDQLRDELDEQRELHRHDKAVQAARCLEVHGALTEALVTLRGVVVNETARAAADTVLHESTRHPHELPAAPPALEGER